jgi:SAM-dependent methyltransferase
MKSIRPCSAKTHTLLVQEWDRLAEERHRQIASGEDLSFHHVVSPTALRLFEGADPSVVLDIGSGTGEFTVQLATIAKRVIAVEPSQGSMRVARRVCGDVRNVHYVEVPLEEAIGTLGERTATAAVAMMTLMTAPDLHGFAKALAGLLRTRARFVATLTHPCFWPRYWGYEGEPWFHYQRETFIEAPFVISKSRTAVRTTHIHRPIELYISVFAEHGFRLDSLVEPMPASGVEAKYPEPWKYPRFLGLRWERMASA